MSPLRLGFWRLARCFFACMTLSIYTQTCISAPLRFLRCFYLSLSSTNFCFSATTPTTTAVPT